MRVCDKDSRIRYLIQLCRKQSEKWTSRLFDYCEIMKDLVRWRRNQERLQLRYLMILLITIFSMASTTEIAKRGYSDRSIQEYVTERTCWWNEVCKEEFQSLFRCKCPAWSVCRSPGRYYNAFCSMTETGYIWLQPNPHNGSKL